MVRARTAGRPAVSEAGSFSHLAQPEPGEPAFLAAIPGSVAAVDLGGTNFDVIVCREGLPSRCFFPAGKPLVVEVLHALLCKSGVERPSDLRWIAVTGGRHQELPDDLYGTPIVKIPELPTAI